MADVKWLEDLKAKIVDQKDSDNFDDIIKCYQAGLLRAGFLMAWLMLIESLKRKVTELEARLAQMKDNREKYNNLNKLNATVPVLTFELEKLRNEYKELMETLKKYRENADAIDKNNEIDNALRMNESNISAKREGKENNLKQIIQIENEITNNIKESEIR
jgi:DNA repair exonuclease SbcCD ATPase subunit